MRNTTRVVSALAVASLASACVDERAPTTTPGSTSGAGAAAQSLGPLPAATPASITYAPRFVGLQVGGSKRPSATVRDSAGNVLTVPVTYSVVDPTVARVVATGSITGLKVGSTYVLARVNSLKDSVAVSVNSIFGLENAGFGPYVDGQNPDFGSVITETQVRQRLLLARPYLRGIRTFGMTGGLEFIPRVGREYNLQVACGAWIGSDLAANALQLAALVAEVNAGRCQVAIVGSETQLRGDVSESQLIAYINSVKSQRTNATPVTTADVFHVYRNSATLRSAVDEIWVNVYPYHGGVDLRYAPAELHGQFNEIKTLGAGKRTVLSETGWPSCGATKGAAVPSVANLASYFRSVISWSRATGNTVSYFEVFDESWKAWRGNLEEACFGFLDKNGVRKQGVGSVFNGNVVPDNWTLPAGPGAPTLLLTYVPPLGSFDDLRGQVEHLSTTANQVAVFIKVNGGYWTKPTFANPATPLAYSGSFVTDITTGGTDETATEVAVFVLPKSYAIPLLNGAATLPSSLAANAIASAIVTR